MWKRSTRAAAFPGRSRGSQRAAGLARPRPKTCKAQDVGPAAGRPIPIGADAGSIDQGHALQHQGADHPLAAVRLPSGDIRIGAVACQAVGSSMAFNRRLPQARHVDGEIWLPVSGRVLAESPVRPHAEGRGRARCPKPVALHGLDFVRDQSANEAASGFADPDQRLPGGATLHRASPQKVRLPLSAQALRIETPARGGFLGSPGAARRS